MTHLGPGSSCPGCATKRETLHPILSDWLEEIQKEYPDSHIAFGFRDEASQEQCFKDGATDYHWPDSKHNVMMDGKPCSEAFDLFRLLPTNKADYAPKYFLDIAYLLFDWCAPIKWGGYFKNKDMDHFELDKTKLEEHIV